ncbi:hypothetical protein EDB83DRAFT_2677014 [Lactarius deliciosus]|nr:hypothetical protein EDB83DRAFT_2677014 [Lactarius deliciosus]
MTSFSSRTSAPSLDEDQTAVWSLTTGCAQLGSGFTSDRKAVSQQQYGTSHTFPEITTTGFGYGPGIDPAAALWGTPEGVLRAVANGLNHPHLDFASWITPTLSLTDTSSAASPWSTNTLSTGIVPSQVPSTPNQASVAYSQGPVPPESRGLALPSSSQSDQTWLSEPNPFAGTGSSYLVGWKTSQCHLEPGYTGVSPEYNYTGIGNTLYYPGQWLPTGPFGPDYSTAINIEADLQMVPALTTPGIILGKRARTNGMDGTVDNGHLEAEAHVPRPRKKGKGLSKTQGILEVAGPSSKAQHKPATRDPKQGNNHISEAMGCGARGHAATNAQGLYDRFLPGPSVQQELTEAIAQGLTWVEESTQGEEPRWMGGTAQQQQYAQNSVGVKEGGPLFPIPKSLRERYSKLLAATEADWECGAVSELRCRLCPGARFSAWEGFERHCDTTRVHPWDIYICDHCGDYFGRSDSFMRHRRRRPQVCQKAVPERARAKGRDIRWLHDNFKVRVVRCPNDGGDIGVPFFRIVGAKYPSSSKDVVEDTPREYD